LVVFHRHTGSARRTVGALGSDFPEAEAATLKFDHSLRHHRTAAPIALHRHLPSVTRPDDITQRYERIKNIVEYAQSELSEIPQTIYEEHAKMFASLNFMPGMTKEQIAAVGQRGG
jgi:hypothetical protein